MNKPKAEKKKKKPSNKQDQNRKPQKIKTEKKQQAASWCVVRGLLICRNVQTQQKQPQPIIQRPKQKQEQKKKKKLLREERVLLEDYHHHQSSSKKCKKMKCSGSICNNTKITASNNNHDASSRSMKPPSSHQEPNGVVVSASSSSSLSAASSSSSTTSFRGMPFRRLSGCYECRMVVDPVLGITRDPSLRGSMCSCPDCGEIFIKAETLELHQAIKHAVSELGGEDTSKNIVEIIFQSSWLKKQSPVCKMERILKVHNTQKTISRFEEYRESIKAKATKKHPRCIADGNELLRFHSTTFLCSLGLNGSSTLCNSIPHCHVCTIIKNGFAGAGEKGILTTATSGKAHDKASSSCEIGENDKRAMLVCRVIAGRVKNFSCSKVEGIISNVINNNNMEECDSVGAGVGAFSNLDELYVFNPTAILPCFVVIYSGFSI